MPENQAEPIIETYDWAHFIIQSIPVGIFTVDSQMRITDFNPRAEELIGYPRSQ